MPVMNGNAKRRKIILNIFFLAIIVELAMQSFLLNSLGMYISPIVSILSGITVALTAFWLTAFKEEQGYKTDHQNPSKQYKIMYGSFAIGAIISAVILYFIFLDFPVDAKASDIIPSLEMYVRRFLAGEVVYRPLFFESYAVNPTYLPLLWAPYIVSEVLGIDYRWTAYFVFLLAIFLYQLKLVKKNLPVYELVLKSIIPFVLIIVLAIFTRSNFGLAVELLPIGFYLLLTLSIFDRRPWLMALGILICLLSRYAFTFWLPVYLLIYWIEYGFGRVFRVSLYVLVGVLGLYVIPFLSKNWTILKKGLDYYETTAVRQWEPQIWQPPDAVPHHLSGGLSLAIYFYGYEKYTVKDRLARNRKAHIAVCAFTALLILLGYFYYRKRGLDTKMYLIIGLKLYLVIFYGFFYVPFGYLYQLPLFLSIPLIYNISFSRKQKELKPGE